ncbi:MAG: hypothetical protein HYZ09_02060 [Candidatus Kerfeldbacteria bacterium]|nr:hypothetical protein [Candidatus Kerfeldbacteria bacterium]
MAKRLFFVSAAILMLMVAYQLGARNVQAQSGGQIVAAFGSGGSGVYVVTSNGDTFFRPAAGNRYVGESAESVGNFWGGTVAVQPETWGGVKQKFR